MFDRLTGQYYLRARYYVLELGRFTQADTFHGDGLNLYVYAGNNPVRYVDPEGHCCKNSGVDDTNINTRHYDFKHLTKYEKVIDYINGKKNKVKGDKYMYYVNNNVGGDLVVSTRPINKNSFLNTLEYFSGQNKDIVILSGTHGTSDGYSALSINSLAEISFFNEDVVTSKKYSNVKVIDVAKMSKDEFNQCINSNNVVICAWCYSERSQEIIEAIKRTC